MTSSDRPAGACPDDETLAAYVEARLDAADREAVEGHVATCPTCLDVVAVSVSGRLETGGMSEVSDAVPAQRSSARAARRWRIGRGWAVAASLVLLFGGFLAVAQPFRGLGSGLARLASRWLGTPLTIHAVALRLGAPGTFVVSLRDVRLGGTDDLFRADAVEVTVALAALASGTVPVRALRLVHPVVELAKPESLAIAWAPEGSGRVLRELGDLDRVDVVDGRVLVRGSSRGVDAVNGALVRDAESAKVALQGRAGPGLVTVDGRLGAGRSAMTIGVRDVEAVFLPGLSDGTGTVDLSADVSGTGTDVRVDGRVVLRHGRLVGYGFRRLLDERVATVVASTSPAFAGDDLPFDEGRAVFRWRHGAWRLPRFFVTAGGIVAGGRVRLERGEVIGRGTMRIPTKLADSLVVRAPELATERDEGGVTLPFVLGGTRERPRLSFGGR